MSTKKLYREDIYCKETQAAVTGLAGGDHPYVVTDRTIFFPEGGGQSADRGTINGTPVMDVQEEGDEIRHYLSPGEGVSFKEGDTVTLKLDWAHRFENMQRHCGEHILSGRFYAMYGGVNRGFHMGEDAMTIDISLEEDPSYTEVTYDMALAAQDAANEIIWSALPVTVDYFDTNEEASAMPVRKAVAFDEDISIVTIGDRDHPADCVACCGTHPSDTGQVGLVKVYKVEKNKGMWRVFFDAGSRAMKELNAVYEMAHDLSDRFTTGIEDLPAKLAADQQKYDDLLENFKSLRDAQVKRIVEACLDETELDLRAGITAPSTVTPLGMRPDDFNKAAKTFEDQLFGTLLIRFPEQATLLLFSDGDFPCGATVKTLAPAYGGKGGGSPIAARAVFPSKEDMDAFAAKLGARQDRIL